MILTKKDGLEFSFKTNNGNIVTAYIPRSKIIERLEEDAYEIITTDTNCTCGCQNYCECDPINEDAKLDSVSVCVGK